MVGSVDELCARKHAGSIEVEEKLLLRNLAALCYVVINVGFVLDPNASIARRKMLERERKLLVPTSTCFKKPADLEHNFHDSATTFLLAISQG